MRCGLVLLGIYALLAFMGISLSGCGVLIARPTSAVEHPTPTLVYTSALPTAQPTRGVAPIPTATPSPAKISFTDEDVQFWSNVNAITGLLVTEEAVWAAAEGGVVRWGRDGTPTVYTVRDGLAPQPVRGIAQDGQGRIWIGYEGIRTWSMFDGAAWQAYPDREKAVEAHYEALLAAPAFDPRLWVARPGSRWLWLPRGDGRVEAYDGARWRIYGTQHGVRRDSWMVAVSPQGQVWAVGEGVSTAEEGDLWWDDHDYFSEIASPQEVTGAAVDGEGALWVSFAASPRRSGRTAGPSGAVGGVARYNLALNRWEGYLASLTEAIPRRVYDVRITADGTLWLAGEGRVVVRRPSRPWQAFEAPGLTVRAVAQGQDGLLWLGTDRGLWSFQPESGSLEGPKEIPSPFVGREVVDIATFKDGHLVVATDGGATLLSPSGETRLLVPEAVVSLAAAPNGLLWFSTASGLYRLDSTLAPIREGDQEAVALAVDPLGNLWLCTPEGEVLRFARRTPEHRANILALAGELPRNIAVDHQGTVWFSLSRGLGELTREGQFTLIGVEPLLSADVRRVAVGEDGTLWVATAKGLARRLPSGRWTRFTVESTGGGLLAMDLSDVRVAPGGAVWVASAAGLSRRDAEGNWANVPLAGIQRVVEGGQDILWAASPSGIYRVRLGALTPIP